jgi:NADH-quinone oxidoreductase subunit C
MNNREMAVLVENVPGVSSSEERYDNQIEVRADAFALPGLLSYLKSNGFAHLSNILAVDWIEEGEFELVYNLFSYVHKLHATVKARVDREIAHAPSILTLWPQAQVYEREIHEFFGILFDGNPNLEPFFLHNWQDSPPLRKDFDTEEYSRRAYGMIDDGVEHAKEQSI